MRREQLIIPKELMFEKDFVELNRDLSYKPNPHSPHYKVLKYINNGSRVLDVGCCWGNFAKLLKQKNCYVVGIEKDLKFGMIAEQYCDKVIIGDVENIDVQDNLRGSLFDIVVCMDVLEHLVRPDKLVFHLKNFLAPGGKIIVSIPNIARIENRINIFCGRFNYEDAGALSRGHLRFFTKCTARELLLDAGYKNIKIEYTGLASIIKIFPTLTAYQFLLIATV